MLKGWLTQLGAILAMVVGALSFIFIRDRKKKAEGYNEAQDDLIESDAHIAREMRDTLRDNDRKSVRDHSDAGWRD